MSERENIVQLNTMPSFEDFWKAYPYVRRERKVLALAKWNAITGGGLKTKTYDRDSNTYMEIELSATPEEIVDGVKKYSERNRVTGLCEFGFKDDGKYICQPATWLNQGRWMDE